MPSTSHEETAAPPTLLPVNTQHTQALPENADVGTNQTGGSMTLTFTDWLNSNETTEALLNQLPSEAATPVQDNPGKFSLSAYLYLKIL